MILGESPTMGVLIDLPDDILRDIFEELVVLVDKWRNRFEKDKKSLSSLMQTNRRLNRLASRILLREIKINIVCREKYKGAFRKSLLAESCRNIEASS